MTFPNLVVTVHQGVPRNDMSIQLKNMPDTPASTSVLGVRVDRVTREQALDRIERMIASRRASAPISPFQHVVTVNTEFVMAAQRFASATMVSMPVIRSGTGDLPK